MPGSDVTSVSRRGLTPSDIAKAEADCAAIGIPLVHPRADARGIDSNRGMWSVNPDGNRMEIVEVSPDCIQYRAVANYHAGDGPHIVALG